MRIGPLFLTAVFYLWAFLAGIAWALSETILRREPTLWRLLAGLLAGAAGVAVAVVAGGRGGLSLLMTFPACFGASLAACILAGWIWRPLVRGAGRGLP